MLDTSVDLGLSMFVWEAVSPGDKRCFLALFDMNCWYNAQMPTSIRCVCTTCYILFIFLSGRLLRVKLNVCLSVHNVFPIWTNDDCYKTVCCMTQSKLRKWPISKFISAGMRVIKRLMVNCDTARQYLNFVRTRTDFWNSS